MKKILFVLLILIVIAILAAGYLGLIPAISAMLGTNKAKDLGVKYSQENLTAANEKTKVEIKELPSGANADKSLTYEGSHPAELTLSSEEITAMVNNSKWKYNPLSQVQVKINPDGSAEASGYIDFNAAKSYALALGVSTADIDSALKKFPIPTTKFPFYVKLTGSVTNNQIDMNVANLKLGNIPVPTGLISTYSPAATSFIESKYLSNTPIKVEKIENQAGKAYFKGNLPNSEFTAR